MNKEKIGKLIGYTIGIILLPILIPISLIFKFTKGKELNHDSYSTFIQSFISTFQKEIFKDLNISELPNINISSDIFGAGKVLGKMIKPGYVDTDMMFTKSITVVPRTDSSRMYINIYCYSIFTRSFKHGSLAKLSIIKTIIHELRHYEQCGNKRFEGNHSSTFDEYKKEPAEIEARKASRIFTFKHVLKIIKFLIKN